MKANKLRTSLIVLSSIFYTANLFIRIIFMNWRNKITRPWVNNRLLIWSKQLLNQVGVTCTIINPHHIEPQPGKPTIIICNHSSLYDIPISFLVFPNHPIRMLAKKELSKIPLMEKAIKASESRIIDRHNKKQIISDLKAIRTLINSGIIMWIAPEGTRSADGKLAPFKKGAFISAIQAKATIIPIGICGAHNILQANTFSFKMNQAVEVRVGDPIDASKYTTKDKEALAVKAYEAMRILVQQNQ